MKVSIQTAKLQEQRDNVLFVQNENVRFYLKGLPIIRNQVFELRRRGLSRLINEEVLEVFSEHIRRERAGRAGQKR